MAAQMNLPDGKLVRVMENWEEILKLRGRTRMQLTSKEDEKPLKKLKSKLNIYHKLHNNGNN